MAHIKLINAGKSFGDVEALKDINLELQSGEFTVFVGPSGCGKSTLLRMIAGLETMSTGVLEIDGVVMNDVPPSQRGVAMVFQSYALYPHMTVADNMAFALKIAKKSSEQINEAVHQAADTLELGHLLERLPKELSGGQRQRVAIGRAIVRDPSVFLFDEPLSNLDAALRAQTRLEIAKLHEALSASMIYVTHDQVEAMTLADKIVLLNTLNIAKEKGSIAQVGAPLELYHHPANRFVSEFIGSPKMNFMPGKIEKIVNGGCTRIRLCNHLLVEVHADVSRSSIDAEVEIGIRPEHFSLKQAEGAVLKGRVAYVERLGEASYVHFHVDNFDGLITARYEGDAPFSAKDSIQLSLPASQCHLFDKEGKAFQRAR